MYAPLQSFLGRNTIVCCVCLALLSPSAVAQVSSETVPLTLKDTMRLALKQNIDLQISNLDAAVAQQDSNVARVALLP